MKLCLIFVTIVTSIVTLSGHPSLSTGRDPVIGNPTEMQTPPLYWTLIKTPGIGHELKDYYNAEKILPSLQTSRDNLPSVQHSVPSYNHSLLKPTTNLQNKTLKNETFQQLSSKSQFVNEPHFTTSEEPKNGKKISNPKNYFAFVWLPESDSISTEAITQPINDPSSFAIGGLEEVSDKEKPNDRSTSSEILNVREQNRSPRIYSIGRGLSSFLSMGNGEILPMFIFDALSKCPPGYQMDSQGSCKQIFSFGDSIYNKDSMYSSPAKPSLTSEQINTLPKTWVTTSTFSSIVEEFSDKPLEGVKPTDIFVIGVNDSDPQPEDLPHDNWESVTMQSIYEPFISGSANQENISTNSFENITIENQLVVNSTEHSGNIFESFSNLTDSEVTSSKDFSFDFTEYKMNNNDSSANQEGDSANVFEYLYN